MGSESSTTSAVSASPELVAPRDAAIVDGQQVTFEWRAVSDAAAYRLEVAADTSFRNVAFEKELPADTTAVTVADFFPVDKQTYFWRVLAKNEAGWSHGERVESFVSASAEEAQGHMQRPDETRGPVTQLVQSASTMVADRLSEERARADRLEEERERGVAYEGIPSGQILGIAFSILAAIAILVILLFQWTSITRVAIREAAVDPSDYTLLRETELQAQQKLSQYEVISEQEGTYRIPIEEAMQIMATEAYQQGNRPYADDAPFVPRTQ